MSRDRVTGEHPSGGGALALLASVAPEYTSAARAREAELAAAVVASTDAAKPKVVVEVKARDIDRELADAETKLTQTQRELDAFKAGAHHARRSER